MVMGLLASPFPNRGSHTGYAKAFHMPVSSQTLDPRSHLSTLHPSLEVVFSKASVDDDTVIQYLFGPLTCCCAANISGIVLYFVVPGGQVW